MAAKAVEVDKSDIEVCNSIFSEDGFLIAVQSRWSSSPA